MGKINPFFSERSQQIHKMYEKLAIITQIWQKVNFYFTSMSNTSFLITVQDMKKITTFFKHSKFRKNYHNYTNLAQSQNLFYMHQQPVVPDHGTQHEGNPSSHHGGMHEDGWMDGLTDGLTDRRTGSFPIFPHSA